MNLFFIGVFVVLVIGIIILLLQSKKKITTKIVKETTAEEAPSSNKKISPHKIKFHAHKEVSKVINNLKKTGAIRPEGNLQRNLDRETGGVEAEEQMQSGEKDVWDDRSEEVDKMGAINQLGGSGKESMLWRKKKEKMDEKKMDEARNASEAHHKNHKGSRKDSDSRGGQQGGGGRGM